MLEIPTITGIIKRRILLNYRVDPEIVSAVLPKNFRPKLHDGYAVAGICLIRLEEVRPSKLAMLPKIFSISSENSAHRIAVEWDDPENPEAPAHEGVFVPRRDTDSLLNSLAGGRVFPGVHHHSKFSVTDDNDEISIAIQPKDQPTPLIDLHVKTATQLPESSIFTNTQESSKFFENGFIGYSSRPDSCLLDGLLLDVNSADWRVTPLEVISVRSSYFDNPEIFPPGSIHLDHALLMRDIPHSWHSVPSKTSF